MSAREPRLSSLPMIVTERHQKDCDFSIGRRIHSVCLLCSNSASQQNVLPVDAHNRDRASAAAPSAQTSRPFRP